ncbi:MAG TPA: DnaJ domain-containing protein [Pyrinomonadaceae bacterium]|nr:DnaJ domain-containing protein [Pyrinomonadaceae bacterium]
MGKLTEQPLAELIREISIKALSGTLRLEYERMQTAVYFDKGQLIYAASNLRTLRLREYLVKRELIPEKDQAKLENGLPDLELAEALAKDGTLRQKDIDALLVILVSDILRVSLLWTEGTWDFNGRARLADSINVKIDTGTLLREAAQRMPLNFVSGRFRNPGEMIARAPGLSPTSSFRPAESFILSRLDKPIRLEELISLSGLPEPETRRVLYGLALSDFITREYWQNAFRTDTTKSGQAQSASSAAPAVTAKPEQSDNWLSASIENVDLEEFLKRLKTATNHYQVLELPATANISEIKDTYYSMARRYHPDRFHLKSGTKVHAEISSAFARVTQAYETLTNPNARAGYDHTLERTRQYAEAEAQKAAKTRESGGSPEHLDPDRAASETGVDSAEYSFREGSGALEQGRIRAAIQYLSNAARLEPKEARYRAYYGRALAADENTRRLAENEFQAAIKLEPANALFRTMLAELYFELKFHRRAQTELDRALAIDPHNAAANLLLRKLAKSRKVG